MTYGVVWPPARVFAEGSLPVLLMAITSQFFQRKAVSLCYKVYLHFFFVKVRASQGELEAAVY